MKLNLSFNPSKTVDEIVKFIKNTVYKAGFSRVVVGLSGGVDSAVSTILAVKALGRENVYVGLFPYGELNKEGLNDARLMIKKLNIPPNNIFLIDIKPLVDIIYSSSPSTAARGKLESRSLSRAKSRDLSSRQARTINSETDSWIDNLRRGNVMVRVRMILLYDLSKKINGLVLGTENKTEHLLGYFTRFGDEASDLEPIRHLYKTQVKQLAQYLKIPEKIIEKSPTAGLWDGQTDEGEFGFSYEEADKILHLYADLRKKREEIEKMGFKKEVVEKVISRVEANKFKHELPYSI